MSPTETDGGRTIRAGSGLVGVVWRGRLRGPTGGTLVRFEHRRERHLETPNRKFDAFPLLNGCVRRGLEA